MRSRIWIVTVVAAGFLSVGAAAPAYAAVDGASPARSSVPSAEPHRTNNQDGMPDMGRMHEQMMTNHPADVTPSAHVRGNQGE